MRHSIAEACDSSIRNIAAKDKVKDDDTADSDDTYLQKLRVREESCGKCVTAFLRFVTLASETL